jgi:hypothetical protein
MGIEAKRELLYFADNVVDIMAQAMFPLAPPMSCALGEDFFVTVSCYNEIVRVHVRKYKRGALTYFPTPQGIYMNVDEWHEISKNFRLWQREIESDSPMGVLHSSAKMGISYFSFDGRKIINFTLANNKAIDLSTLQFDCLCQTVDHIAEWEHALTQNAQRV